MKTKHPPPFVTLQMRRMFPTSRDKLFKAWTDPQELVKWFGPMKNFKTLSAQVELKVGGKFVFVLRSDDGDYLTFSGNYLDIVVPERLVFTWRLAGETLSLGETIVSIDLNDHSRTTELVLRHEFPDALTYNMFTSNAWVCFSHVLIALQESFAVASVENRCKYTSLIALHSNSEKEFLQYLHDNAAVKAPGSPQQEYG